MRGSRLWVGVGAVSAALVWGGCQQKEQQEGAGGSGPAAQVEQAQQETQQAFEQARQKQQEASSKQQEAQTAQQQVQKEQQELQQAEQQAQAKGQQAQQAQQDAQQTAQQSQQRAQQAQQQASQAMQQQQQQQEQQRAEQARQMEQQSQQPQQATGGSGMQQQVSGELSSAQSNAVVIQSASEGSISLKVDPSTQVFIDGQQGSIQELQQGSDVRASYTVDQQNNQKKAIRIEVTSAQGGQQPQQGSQIQPQPTPQQ